MITMSFINVATNVYKNLFFEFLQEMILVRNFQAKKHTNLVCQLA